MIVSNNYPLRCELKASLSYITIFDPMAWKQLNRWAKNNVNNTGDNYIISNKLLALLFKDDR